MARAAGVISKNGGKRLLVLAAVLVCGIARATSQEAEYQVDPSQTSVQFTLGDVLHTVRGTFKLKSGNLQLQANGHITGEIVVHAGSGNSGSAMRDRKMHREVLESAQYPDISFRPDRIDGTVAGDGKSSVMVHGIFRIHGADREITVPAKLDASGDHWSATVHFTLPYAKWGMKNPSTLFLRVSDTVEIDLAAAGNIVRHTASSNQ